LLGGAVSAHGFARPPELPVQVDRVSIQLAPVAPDAKEIREALEKRRAKNLAAFRAYRKAGVYPHNTFRAGPLNVWIDAEGNLCAAATMISKDGKHQLVIDTGATNNQIRLLNVTEGVLLEWILTSGFTIEEIDRIQAPGIMSDGSWSDGRPWMPELVDWTAEDARLRRLYAATDAFLVKTKKQGLDVAVKRLMANPELARKLVDGTL
jgi:hypothetical protein